MACELLHREIPNAAGTNILVGCRQLAASKSLDLHIELVGKMGNAVFPFIEDKYNFADIIYMMKMAKDDNLTELLKRVCCMVTLDGEPLTAPLFDVKFSGDLMLIYKVFSFVVETNFRDFFKEGLAINAQRQLEAEAALKAAELKNSSPDQTSV